MKENIYEHTIDKLKDSNLITPYDTILVCMDDSSLGLIGGLFGWLFTSLIKKYYIMAVSGHGIRFFNIDKIGIYLGTWFEFKREEILSVYGSDYIGRFYFKLLTTDKPIPKIYSYLTKNLFKKYQQKDQLVKFKEYLK